MKKTRSITVLGPASSANLGSGFDCFAISLDNLYDTVKISKNDNSEISIKNFGLKSGISTKPEEHTGGIVAINILKEFNLSGIDMTVDKGVPPGKGLGSSAATAAAVTVGLDRLFSLKLSNAEKLKFAASGEIASAGISHADNVAGSLFGGFVVINSSSCEDIVSFSPPKNLHICIGIPKTKSVAKKTGKARKLIPSKVKFTDSVVNVSYASMMVAGFSTGNKQLIGRSMNDNIVESARSSTIPNYTGIKSELLDIGALGVTISGAGPSIISFTDNKKLFPKIKKCFKTQFKSAGFESSVIVTRIGKGARVIR